MDNLFQINKDSGTMNDSKTHYNNSIKAFL